MADLIAEVQTVIRNESRYAEALRKIAGNGDEFAGIHLVEECNFECEWWCAAHERCAEAELCSEALREAFGEVEDLDCLFVQHIHCVEGCPTRIALAALAGREV